MAEVLVTRRPLGDAIERIQKVARVVIWEEDRPIPRDELLNAVSTIHGLYCMLTDRIDDEMMMAAPHLQVISQMAVGVDNIDLASATALRIPVGHTPEVLTETTADTAFALLLAAARRVGEGIDHVRDGRWGPWDPQLLLGTDVHGATLGVVGMGRIGAAIARRAGGFDMRVLYSGSRKPDLEARLGLIHRTLDQLLSESDHVVASVPLTEETRAMFNDATFARMRPSATFVNIARGAVVDHDALSRALEDGTIGAAALDVTDPEPIPADHPLVTDERCTILPHLGSSSGATREAMASLAADNLIAGLTGDPLVACANPAVYAEPDDED